MLIRVGWVANLEMMIENRLLLCGIKQLKIQSYIFKMIHFEITITRVQILLNMHTKFLVLFLLYQNKSTNLLSLTIRTNVSKITVSNRLKASDFKDPGRRKQ